MARASSKAPSGNRGLPPEAQEDLRRGAFAVAPQSVPSWVQAWRKQRSKGLAGHRWGRRPGEQKAWGVRQQRKLRYAVAGHTPAAFRLTGLVWTPKTVAELIRVRHGIVLSLTTVGKYLHSWGLSPRCESGWPRCPQHLVGMLIFAGTVLRLRRHEVVPLGGAAFARVGTRRCSVTHPWLPIRPLPDAVEPRQDHILVNHYSITRVATVTTAALILALGSGCRPTSNDDSVPQPPPSASIPDTAPTGN
ncbi:winged helix-turn-helix domain-containing protein [Saccharopolyspora spinosa]|uniref:winged helix-turn-helix domain-containing protein n=1 Tax=Saccharopolyspora spinosa TaxID=60894 RepID=UPI000A018571